MNLRKKDKQIQIIEKASEEKEYLLDLCLHEKKMSTHSIKA